MFLSVSGFLRVFLWVSRVLGSWADEAASLYRIHPPLCLSGLRPVLLTAAIHTRIYPGVLPARASYFFAESHATVRSLDGG